MEVAGIVLHQVTIMLLLLLVGMLAAKRGILTISATRVFCNVLLMVVVPSTIINAYYRTFEKENVYQLFLSFALAAGFHFFAILLSRILIRKDKGNKYRMERLGVIYSNCGFMGFPVLTALLGEDGIFLGTAFIAMFNIFIWTEGIKTLKEGEKIGIKKALINPGCIGVAIGLLLYFTQIKLPAPVVETVAYLSSMNTPLAMIITGVFLLEVSPKEVIRDFRAMYISVIKTLVIPLLFLAVLILLQTSAWFDGAKEVCIAVIIGAACPTGASVILIPASMNMDGSEGTKLMAISTLFSIITLPLVSYFIYIVL